jgi:cysteine desulfurase
MIYLDYAATAPLRPSIAQAIAGLCAEPLGNPSSLHRAGRRARQHLEEARERCARALGARVEEIVFTSGATEADNLALLGVLGHPDARHHGIVTSALEHAAVYETARKAEADGIPVRWLAVNQTGQVVAESLQTALRQHPCQLVSVMACNNEIGSRQPLQEISVLAREHGSLLHVDAVQDPASAPLLIRQGRADLVTLSGHKLGGLPGGLLYVRQGVPLAPLILGGAQEDGRRAGTSEVLRAVSMALALEASLAETSPEAIRDLLESHLENIPGARRLGPDMPEQRAGHISAWLFDELPAEPVLAQLDLAGVCASSGSACSSHAIEPSRVLQAMGLGQWAMGLVRFSCGWKSSGAEARRAGEIVQETVVRMMARDRVKR